MSAKRKSYKVTTVRFSAEDRRNIQTIVDSGAARSLNGAVSVALASYRFLVGADKAEFHYPPGKGPVLDGS